MFENTEALVKVRDIVAGGSGALNTPVSFVSKVVTETIEGISLESAAAKLLPLDTEKAIELSSVAERLGSEAPSTIAGANKLLNEVASGISSSIGSAQSIMGGVLKDVSGVIPNLLGSTISSAKDLVASIPMVPSMLDTMRDLSDLSSLAGTLPNKLMNMGVSTISDVITGSFNDTSENNDILQSAIRTLTPQFSNMKGVDLPDMITKMYSYGVTNDGGFKGYPRFTNKDYTKLDSTFGSNRTMSGRNMSDMDKMINELCNGNGLGGMYPFGLAKDKYDLLGMILSALGLSGGLGGLFNCRNLYDDRSSRALNSYSRPTSINRGDPNTYGVITDILGVEGIMNPMHDLTLLNANMTLDDRMEDVDGKLRTYDSLLDVFGTDVSSLVSGSTDSSYSSFDTTKIATMMKSNTQVATNGLGSDIAKTALGVLNTWM